jgi:hypothetical protein
MEEPDITLRRVKGDDVAMPLGWRIHGVISPVGKGQWQRFWGLLCSSHGIIMVRRASGEHDLGGRALGGSPNPAIDRRG